METVSVMERNESRSGLNAQESNLHCDEFSDPVEYTTNVSTSVLPKKTNGMSRLIAWPALTMGSFC